MNTSVRLIFVLFKKKKRVNLGVQVKVKVKVIVGKEGEKRKET